MGLYRNFCSKQHSQRTWHGFDMQHYMHWSCVFRVQLQCVCLWIWPIHKICSTERPNMRLNEMISLKLPHVGYIHASGHQLKVKCSCIYCFLSCRYNLRALRSCVIWYCLGIWFVICTCFERCKIHQGHQLTCTQ